MYAELLKKALKKSLQRNSIKKLMKKLMRKLMRNSRNRNFKQLKNWNKKNASKLIKRILKGY